MYSFGIILLLAIHLQCVKVEIAKELTQRDSEPVLSSLYNVEWVNLWNQPLHSERTLMISMFNKMCILEGNRLILVAVQPAANETSSTLQQVALTEQERSVKFAKGIMWESKYYLFVCYENDSDCGLYTGDNDFHLSQRQIINDQGRPVDATFFTQANRLYLVVAKSTVQFPAPSVIYHWTGTHMVAISWVLVIGVISVTAFNYKNSIMIIFGQNEKRTPDIGSKIYEFHNNRIELIQYLPTNGPISIHCYTHKKEIFLVVISELEASNLYWWDGDEFLRWIDLPYIVAPSMINVAHFNGDTLSFVSHESHITLYKVSGSEYLRLSLLELKNGERIVDVATRIDEREILILFLITVDPTNLYRIKCWELRMKENYENNLVYSSI